MSSTQPTPTFVAGDRVLVRAIVGSVDHKRGTVKVTIGWGPRAQVMTVPVSIVERPVPKAIREAATWAEEVFRVRDTGKH